MSKGTQDLFYVAMNIISNDYEAKHVTIGFLKFQTQVV
jgi:hypothetical protein